MKTDELITFAENLDNAGLNKTAIALYDLIPALREEMYQSIRVHTLQGVFYSNRVDLLAALRHAHEETCGCQEMHVRILDNTIRLCSVRIPVTEKDLWVWACRYDDIDNEASFVVFSRENPYAKLIDTIGA